MYLIPFFLSFLVALSLLVNNMEVGCGMNCKLTKKYNERIEAHFKDIKNLQKTIFRTKKKAYQKRDIVKPKIKKKIKNKQNNLEKFI